MTNEEILNTLYDSYRAVNAITDMKFHIRGDGTRNGKDCYRVIDKASDTWIKVFYGATGNWTLGYIKDNEPIIRYFNNTFELESVFYEALSVLFDVPEEQVQ